MNTNYRLSSFNNILYFLFIFIVSPQIFAQAVTNGGFESSDTGVVSNTEGWLMFGEGITPSTIFEIVDNTVKQGTHALKVTVNGLGTNPWDIQAVADSISVIPGLKYNYSIWAKADKPGAQVAFTVGNYSYSEYAVIRPANLTTNWKEYKLTFTVNDDQSYIRAPIHFSYSGNSGNSIYIDNLKIVDESFGREPILVEAENGQIGSDFAIMTDGEVNYVTANSDYIDLSSPGDTSRMITYQVTFEDSGYYNLFARVRVGSGGFDDDSFFYARGFGEKSDTASADWVFINGLGSAGFSDSSLVVDGVGSVGNGIWKWINITKNTYSGVPGDTFYVSSDSLTKVFQVGHREDGLDFDKFAFGKTNLFYTVDILDKQLLGLTELPEIDDRPAWEGPALAEGDAKFLGNAADNPNVTYLNYWTQITPENAGKWASVGISSDTTQWNWSGLDRVYNFAKENNIPFKNHTLIWGAQQPDWLSNTGLTSEQQLAYIETWMRMIGQKYPDMDMIDAVNEPLVSHNPPDGRNNRANYKEALGGDGTTGWDWVIKSFELARKFMPNTKLILNDYAIINSNSATTSYLTIINLLNERGLIDGIGVQGHRFELESANVSTIKGNLDRLYATGLPIYISEFDLGNLSNSGAANDDRQLELYQKIFPVLWEHPGVKGITLWGYLEGQIWQSTCYLVRETGSARPALLWLADYVKNNPTGIAESITDNVPTQYQLEQNYPNPFNPSTTIRYSIVNTAKVTLKVYDTLGREIQTLVNKVQSPGHYTVSFNAQNISSGIYFYQLNADSFSSIKKLIVLK